jgi:hypothetical protein
LGKVDCFAISGLRVLFYSSDHPPPHIHVIKPEAYEIRVYFLDCTENYLAMEIKWPRNGKGPDGREARELLDLVLANRVQLLEEWERKVCPR